MIQSKTNIATHLPENGCGVKTIQEFFGYKDVSTTMIYTYVFHRGGLGLCSPVDGI